MMSFAGGDIPICFHTCEMAGTEARRYHKK